MDTIIDRIDAVRDRIARAAQRAGRSSEEVTLVAVTKTHPARLVAQALMAGVVDMGENRVQEAVEKITLLSRERARIRWHLIGHVQRNKAKQAAQFDMVHSLDSLRLAEALSQQVESQSLVGQRRLPVLLQVNISGEASKEGFALTGGVDSPDLTAFLAEVETILALPHLEVQGLMTIAPWGPDPQQARPIFRSLRLLQDDLARRFPQTDWHHLSMGMTDDFEVAVEEGATLVRVGRAIFGSRV